MSGLPAADRPSISAADCAAAETAYVVYQAIVSPRHSGFDMAMRVMCLWRSKVSAVSAEQPVIFRGDNLVARTRGRLEPRPVEDRDLAPTIADEPRLAQHARRLIDPCAALVEHLGKELLGL
jgi:hypothetical protein